MSTNESTVFATTLDEAHAPGRTIIWCASFQLAWNELRGVPGAPVAVEPSSEMADKLNASAVTRNDIDEASCTIVVGEPGSSLDSVDASPKFRTMVDDALKQGARVIYAKLDKSYPFKTPYPKNDDGSRLHFRGQPVQCFGLWPLDPVSGSYEDFMASQNAQKNVRVHRACAADDFIIELLGEDASDRMIIARTQPAATLANTVQEVVDHLRQTWFQGMDLSSADTLCIPKISLVRQRNYEPLVDARICSGPESGASIDEAQQELQFKLDEHGATLLSEALIKLGYSSTGRQAPRSFICDGPFLLLLLRSTGQSPYLALWVENSEILRAT